MLSIAQAVFSEILAQQLAMPAAMAFEKKYCVLRDPLELRFVVETAVTNGKIIHSVLGQQFFKICYQRYQIQVVFAQVDFAGADAEFVILGCYDELWTVWVRSQEFGDRSNACAKL